MNSLENYEIKEEVDDNIHNGNICDYNITQINNESENKLIKSKHLLKVIFKNCNKIIDALQDQKDNLIITVNDLNNNLSKSGVRLNNIVEDYDDSFKNLKKKLQNFDHSEEAVKQISNVTNSRNQEEIFNSITRTNRDNNIIDCINIFIEKTKNLDQFFLDENYKSLLDYDKYSDEFNEEKINNKNKTGKLYKHRVVLKKRIGNFYDFDRLEPKRRIKNPMMKIFESYYNMNKPSSSILIPHRRRIFVNYYMTDNKRTTKSFNLANCKSIEEFKTILDRVKAFTKSHRITKNN